MVTFRYFLSLLLAAVTLFTLLQCKQGGDIYISERLTPLWKTENTFKIPESVCPDPTGSVLYVSNMDGKPTEKDGKGFISKLSADGRILELNWITGLDAPKGIGLDGDRLFVSNITEIVEVQISSGEIKQRYPIEGAVFLNDISVASNGTVYCSDMRTGKIYSLQNGATSLWLAGPELENCNGLFCKGQFLYAGTKNKILEIDTATKSISTFADVSCTIDGLEAAGEDAFIFSDWKGSVFQVSRQGKEELLLNTSKAGKNAADIGFVASTGIVYVPTFMDNRVEAYKIRRK